MTLNYNPNKVIIADNYPAIAKNEQWMNRYAI